MSYRKPGMRPQYRDALEVSRSQVARGLDDRSSSSWFASQMIPPMAASLVFACATFLIALIAGFLLEGCASLGQAERANARGAVLVTAKAVEVADQQCAVVARANRDVELARRCEKAYETARLALLASAVAVDSWDRLDARAETSCSIRKAAGELAMVAGELERAGARLPPVVADARAALAFFPPCSEAR